MFIAYFWEIAMAMAKVISELQWYDYGKWYMIHYSSKARVCKFLFIAVYDMYRPGVSPFQYTQFKIHSYKELLHRPLHSKPPLSKLPTRTSWTFHILSARHVSRTCSYLDNAGGAVQPIPEITINAVRRVI